MKRLLQIFFAGVLVAMTWATVTASLDRPLSVAAGEIWADPWGRATLFDAYFAFLTVWLWMAYRARSWTARLGWLVAVCLLGNFAIAVYALWALHRLPPGAGWRHLFTAPEGRDSST